MGIHPRVEFGAQGKKKNTCAPRNNKRKGKLGKATANLARRRLDHSATLKMLLIGYNPAAYRAPGSMNEHK